MNYTFLHPQYFWLLLLLLPMIVWYIYKQHNTSATLQISSLKGFMQSKKSKKRHLRHIPFTLRVLVISFIIIALARPQSSDSLREVSTEGIDIMISLDISGSMMAMDFEPNRMEAAKEVAIEFINSREYDRIGLTIFAGEAFTLCPLTLDHNVLINMMQNVNTGMVEDGTAIGMGLAAAVNRLRHSDAESKVVVLLSDGENNRGRISPLGAAEIAREFGVRVYTVGVGSDGTAPFPVTTAFGEQIREVEVRINEEQLQEMADLTGGRYFRATDREGLDQIYREIDQLERQEIYVEEYTRHAEEFLPFILIAGFLLLAEILIRNTILKTLP
ncbi:VWA domain-containing protein [Marinilabiliaceae bacterium ANBcel2]|nr:VWA domain-containing protein [Marinilabiliaceae bacterium ANBcel2]